MGEGVWPQTSITSHAVARLMVYCPTLNAIFHGGLRWSTSERSTEPASSSAAVAKPHR